VEKTPKRRGRGCTAPICAIVIGVQNRHWLDIAGRQLMILSTTRRGFVGGMVAAPLLARRSWAQSGFPTKTVRIVIGFPAGGAIDILGRLIAPKMQERLGQAVIVENRAGANGLIAAQGVAQSDPDGHTILFGTMGNLAINPVFYAGRPGADMEKDFMPVSHVASLPFTLTVNSSLPVKSVKELIDYAKERPGKVFFGSSGNGGLPHLCGEMLNLQAGIQTVHVPYRGSAPAFTDLASGQVHYVCDAYATALPFIQSGRIGLLATTEPTKLVALAGVPPIKDTLPNFSVGNWFGMVVRAGTPAPFVTRLNQEVAYALQQPDVHERAVTLGLELVGSSPQEFGAFQKKEITRWADVIRAAKVQAE
jgi:tripartite-type tricarboxylate transporter receptor subunit TctC